MALRWTSKAHGDLARVQGFLSQVNPGAAARAVDLILAGVRRLAAHPRLGPRMPEFRPREVRRIVIGDYEVRYEIQDGDLFILRLWHLREDR